VVGSKPTLAKLGRPTQGRFCDKSIGGQFRLLPSGSTAAAGAGLMTELGSDPAGWEAGTAIPRLLSWAWGERNKSGAPFFFTLREDADENCGSLSLR